MRSCVFGSGGGFDGDPVAEGGELGDVVTHAAFDVDAAGVVVGSEVMEAGEGVGEQVPDDDQDGAGDRNQGLELAAAFDDAAVALAEEGVGLGGRGGDLSKRAPQVRVAFAGRPGAALGARLDGLRRDLGPGDQVAGGGELALSSPSSAMMIWAALLPMPGTSSRRCSAGSGPWAGAPAPTVGPGSRPAAGAWAVGIAAIASSIRVVS